MLKFKTFISEASRVEVKQKDVVAAITRVESKVLGKLVAVKTFSKTVGGAIQSVVDCVITTAKDPAVSHNTVNVTAYFDGQVTDDDVEDGEDQFEFIFVYNPDDAKIKIDKSYWDWFKQELADAVVHEMLHRSQARSRNFDVDGSAYLKGTTNDQRYYGRPDEVEAYALNAALEIKRLYKNGGKRALTRPIEVQSPSLQRYLETFQSTDHIVVKNLLKKIYKFLESDI